MSSQIFRQSPLGYVPRAESKPILRDAGEAVVDAVSIKNDHTGGGVTVSTGTLGWVHTSTGPVSVASTKNAAGAIALSTNGGTSETITITNTQGTAAGAIALAASAGGITISSVGNPVTISTTKDVASALALTTNGGTSETVVVTNTQGTAVGAIEMKATAGGIKLKPAVTKGLYTPIVTVTQATSKTTGVTCSSHIGQVTTVALTDAADTQFSFTVTNTACADTTSVVLVTPLMAVGQTGCPHVWVSSVAAGSFVVVVRNVGVAVFNSAITFSFMVFNHSA